jgi:hypothetical protein
MSPIRSAVHNENMATLLGVEKLMEDEKATKQRDQIR